MQFLTYIFGLLLQFTEPLSFTDGDTGHSEDTAEDTGDTTDSGDSGETDTDIDSADTTSDCPELSDTACEAALSSAMSLAGENGGFGCSALATSSTIALWSSIFMIGLRRKE